jgi:hypothetical protein
LRGEHRLRIFENGVLRKIFGPKCREEGWLRKLHYDELHSLYSSPNIVRMIKTRRIRWAGSVAPMGEGRRFSVGRPEVRGHREDLGIGGSTILRWTLGR